MDKIDDAKKKLVMVYDSKNGQSIVQDLDGNTIIFDGVLLMESLKWHLSTSKNVKDLITKIAGSSGAESVIALLSDGGGVEYVKSGALSKVLEKWTAAGLDTVISFGKDGVTVLSGELQRTYQAGEAVQVGMEVVAVGSGAGQAVYVWKAGQSPPEQVS